jgi:hypothetical protein
VSQAIKHITLQDGEDEDLIVVDWEGPGWYKRITESDLKGPYLYWIKVGFKDGTVFVSTPERLLD